MKRLAALLRRAFRAGSGRPMAAALLDYIDEDDVPRPEGAEQEYYSALPRPYRIRNGPLASLDELLLVQRGKELGYTMRNEQFNGIVENIKKENKIETNEQLQAALKQEGMTMADLRRQLERTMLVQRVQQTEVMQKLQVTDTELKAYVSGLHYSSVKFR